MYIAALFNQNGLFQGVGGWMKNPQIHPKAEAFLFRATSAYLHLLRMEALSKVCVDQFRRQREELTIKDERIVFWSPTFVEFLNEWSPFLSSMRMMQNMLLPMVGATVGLRTNVPLSLADAVNKLDQYGFGEQVCRSVRLYWQESGSELKDYRDIDQHFDVIVRHTFLQVAPDEKILAFLPDNPKERSLSRATFDRERDALPYFARAFSKLHDFVESLAASLGITPAAIDQSFGLAQLGMLQVGEEKTLALIVEDVRNSKGIAIGQTPDRRISLRVVPGKVSSPGPASSGTASDERPNDTE